MAILYLDNSATTMPTPPVVEAVTLAMQQRWMNPSALYTPALQVQKFMDGARQTLLQAMGGTGYKLIFTSGGTESNNLALLGAAGSAKKGGVVLVGSLEHPSVSACIPAMEAMGHQVERIPANREGLPDLDVLSRLLKSHGERVVLLTWMQVNNETGAAADLPQISKLRDLYAPKAHFHVDGVQGFLRMPVRLREWGIQSYAVSGHKIHAIKGIGALAIQAACRLSPQTWGGGQEDGLRSGTENTVGIAALRRAVESFPLDQVDAMRENRMHLIHRLTDMIPGAVVNGPVEGEHASPHILNISLPPVRSATMVSALESAEIYLSNGSACASRKQRVSPVLSAMGLPRPLMESALRLSLNPFLTREEMDRAAEEIRQAYAMLSPFQRR